MNIKTTKPPSNLPENLTLELRRGVIILAVLSQLTDEQYGYSLIKRLAEKGFEIDQGTLYPLLRRLEKNGLLQSQWNVEGSRPRRYYVVSSTGKKVLPVLKDEWETLVQVMNELIN
jgi:DNA-binding PadR family transcriptional regulator